MTLPIKFKKVRWKNIFSYGNYFTEVDIENNNLCLIVGDNGCGKSSFTDCILFGLFGKPYKKINKGNIINSINNKDCVVEIEFGVGTDEYKVIRGLKPTIFEIYQNGKLIDQSAKASDYQNYLETRILGGLNHNTFTQMCVVGSANFTPFMQLTTPQRREFIEKLLSLSIFTVSSEITKSRIKENESRIVELNGNVRVFNSQISEKRNSLRLLFEQKQKSEQNNDSLIDELKTQMIGWENELVELSDVLKMLVTKAKETKISDVDEKISSLTNEIANDRHQLTDFEKQIRLWNSGKCPTCQRPFDLNDTSTFDVEKSFKLCDKLTNKIEKFVDDVGSLKEQNQIHLNVMNEGKETNRKVKSIKERIVSNQTQIDRLSNVSNDKFDMSSIEKINIEIENVETKIVSENSLIEEIQNDIRDLKVCLELFKDTGIKSKIIKQFIPLVNDTINNYLDKFNLNVLFELDENFNETIKGRGRDDFVYNNLSEGEKRRVDLAILFAWLKIAELKNSVNTNILCLDEIADGSLDSESVGNLFDIINDVVDNQDKSIYIISHRQELKDQYFENSITVEKDGNFSYMKVNQDA